MDKLYNYIFEEFFYRFPVFDLNSDFAYGEEDHVIAPIKSVEKSLGIGDCSPLLEIEYIVESDLGDPHHTIVREDETRADEEEQVI